MSIDILVPALGESVSEATIAKWHKKPGEQVKVDELILELETEKVTLEVTALANGVMGSILKDEGANVTIGEVVGQINEGKGNAASSSTKTVASVPTPTANPLEVANNVSASQAVNVADKNKSPLENFAPPSVKRLVTENNLNLAEIKGTGRDGRVTKGDVLETLDNKTNSANSSLTTATSSIATTRLVERVRMSRLRKTIAQRLKDSQNVAATLSTFNEIDMTNVIALRQKYREEFEKRHSIKLGFMSFFVKASVEALKQIPSVNAEIDGDDIVYKNYFDISVAVGTEKGLVVPVVRNCQNLNFAQIEQEIMNLSIKARDGTLSMSDLSGGTFTISNGGVYGSLLSTPIINPPQSGILGLHKTQERAVVINGKVEVRPMMYVALSYDHRIIDGKEAVTFLVKLKEAIENPERMLLSL